MRTLLEILRQRWTKGAFTDFDKLLARIVKCDLETASQIRQSWEDLDVLAYDSEGYLVWCNRGVLLCR